MNGPHRRILVAGLLTLAAAGCGIDSKDIGDNPAGEAADRAEFQASGCADIYAPDLLPTFEMTIDSAEWEAMGVEFMTWRDRKAAGLDLKPYHPITFTYGEEPPRPAMVKLQANPSSSWKGEKMGFTISFNETEKGGRFHGLRKIVLHAQPSEQTFLRERLAGAYMRKLGLPAACGNNARLVVNGRYYGVYLNRERSDDEFLERVFPGADEADLWKAGHELENHAVPMTPERHAVVLHPADLPELAGVADLEHAVSVWAAEAMLPDNDGFWAIEHNYLLYDHPGRGFLWLPYDLDATFDFVPTDADPVLWTPVWSEGIPVQQALVLGDPGWRARFVAALERASAAYEPDWLAERLARWSSQIADAVEDDRVKPFSDAEHRTAVQRVAGYFSERARFVRAWLSCDAGGGDDRDGDGAVWCADCNDRDAAVHPGAAEICGNAVDENCNGSKTDCL